MSDQPNQPSPKEGSDQQDRDHEMDEAPLSPVATASDTQTASVDITSTPTAGATPADVNAGASDPIDTSTQQSASGGAPTDIHVKNEPNTDDLPQSTAHVAPLPVGNDIAQTDNVAAPDHSPRQPVPGPGPTALQVEAERRFLERFPNRRYRLLPTCSTNLLCGMFAVQTMLRSEDGVPEPTIRELMAIHDEQIADQVAEIFRGERGIDRRALQAVNNRNMFNTAQLDNIVRVYGERHGVDLRFGYVLDDGTFDMVGRPNENLDNPAQRVIWVHLDTRGAGHYSAITQHNQPWNAYDSIAVFDNDWLAINLSFGALLLCRSFKSEGLPEALRGTIAREIDWNTLANRRNAACWLVNTFRRIGLSFKDTEKKNKTAKTTTDDDKVFLRGARLIIDQYDSDLVFGEKPDNVWNKTAPKSKKYKPKYGNWVRDQQKSGLPTASRVDINFGRQGRLNKARKTSKAPKSGLRDYTFHHPRSLNDMRSITLRLLGDIARCSLGSGVEDRSPGRDQALLATGVSVRDLLNSGLLTREGARDIKEMQKQRDPKSKGKGKATEQDAEEANDEDEDDEDMINEDGMELGSDEEPDECDGEEQSEDDASEISTDEKGVRFTGTNDPLFRRVSFSPKFTPSGSRRTSAHMSSGQPSVSPRPSMGGSPQSELVVLGTPTPSLRHTVLSNMHGRSVSSTIGIDGSTVGQDTPSPVGGEQQGSSSSNKRSHSESPEQSHRETILEITLRTLGAQLQDARAYVRATLMNLIQDLQRDNHDQEARQAMDCWRSWFPNDNFPSRRGSGI